jgi:hypothetical protein
MALKRVKKSGSVLETCFETTALKIRVSLMFFAGNKAKIHEIYGESEGKSK